jgi:hypothetical protein
MTMVVRLEELHEEFRNIHPQGFCISAPNSLNIKLIDLILSSPNHRLDMEEVCITDEH